MFLVIYKKPRKSSDVVEFVVTPDFDSGAAKRESSSLSVAVLTHQYKGQYEGLQLPRYKFDSGMGLRYIEGEDEACVDIEVSTSDKNAPPEALLGGHGTCEYYLVNDFLDSIINDKKPPIDIVRALDMSVPGLIAHEAAMEGGVWKEIPLFWR